MGFETAFAETVGIEGDFSDDPKDSGGATRFGITEAVARANGYTGPMRDLPIEIAKRIARIQYWDALRLDQVTDVAPSIALEMFDTGYNMGVGRAGQFLQRALNAFNREGKDYPDLVVDGVVGNMTLHALRIFIAKRGPEGEAVLHRTLNCLQGAAYIELAERRSKDERFVYGWIRTRVGIA